MTRPITWAVATVALATVAATTVGQQLARTTRSDPVRAAAAGRPADDRTSAGAEPGTLVLQMNAGGHYVAHATVEGHPIALLVDTGATIVALTREDADAAGIWMSGTASPVRIATANGVVAATPVRLREVRIGAIAVRDVDAVVMPRGALGTSLLGMSFLRGLRGFDAAGGRLTLRG